MSDRLDWQKSVDENIKTHPKHFWKHVSTVRKKYADLLQLDLDGIF
jgi:hypothetical protein